MCARPPELTVAIAQRLDASSNERAVAVNRRAAIRRVDRSMLIADASALAAAESLELLACSFVEPVAESQRSLVRMRGLVRVGEEALRRDGLHLQARHATNDAVRRDHTDHFAATVFRCEPLEHGIGVLRETDLELPDPLRLPRAVEHQDTT